MPTTFECRGLQALPQDAIRQLADFAARLHVKVTLTIEPLPGETPREWTYAMVPNSKATSV